MNNQQNNWKGEHLSLEILKSQAGLSSGFWISYAGKSVLVDIGDGILRDIVKRKYSFVGLSAIFITHGHFDHMGGLYTLLAFLRMIGRERPLHIIFPQNSIEIITTINSFFDIYGESIPFDIVSHMVVPGDIIVVDDIFAEIFEMYHCGSIEGGEILDRIPAIGFRLTRNGEVIAVSGDTGYYGSLETLVEGADLAVIEATYPDSDATPDDVLKKVHLNEELATKAGKLAKKYILCHKIEHR